MIHEQVQKTYPMIHAVQEAVPTPAPSIQVSYPGRSVSFNPHQARQEVMQIFDAKQPKPNSNRSPRHLPLELRQVEDQRMAVSSKGPMSRHL